MTRRSFWALGEVIRCIRQSEFWYLKQGVRRILSLTAEKYVFYKPPRLCLKVNSITNRIPCLKVGVLVYKASRLSMCQGQSAKPRRSINLCMGHSVVADCTIFLSLDRQDIQRRQLRCAQNSLRFLTNFAYPFASDQNHANLPNIKVVHHCLWNLSCFTHSDM